MKKLPPLLDYAVYAVAENKTALERYDMLMEGEEPIPQDYGGGGTIPPTTNPVPTPGGPTKPTKPPTTSQPVNEVDDLDESSRLKILETFQKVREFEAKVKKLKKLNFIKHHEI
jgi:hypothetical protein